MMKKLGVIAVIATSLFATTIATAGPREENAVKARRGYFQMVLFDFGPLAGMLKGQVPFDADVAKTHATGLNALADYDVDRLFLDGTSNADMAGKTRLLPAALENREKFAQLNKAWRDQAAALLASVDKGESAFKAELAKLGGTCKACHDDYRAKDF
jgi:cytochrome c556